MPRAKPKARRPEKRSSSRPEKPTLAWEPSAEPDGELDFLFAAPRPVIKAEAVAPAPVTAAPAPVTAAPAPSGWRGLGRAMVFGVIGLAVLGARRLSVLAGRKKSGEK